MLIEMRALDNSHDVSSTKKNVDLIVVGSGFIITVVVIWKIKDMNSRTFSEMDNHKRFKNSNKPFFSQMKWKKSQKRVVQVRKAV